MIMSIEKKVLVTTVPFGKASTYPLELLESSGLDVVINPIGRRLKPEELGEMIGEFDAVIAGTEPINESVLKRACKLKQISRVGIGLDNVNLSLAKELGIRVCYTPEAPSPAVADLTVCLMLSLLRGVGMSNMRLQNKIWERFTGKHLSEITIGVVGLGRVGERVLNRIACFGTPRILVNDINPNFELGRRFKIEWVSKSQLFSEADLITLHVPLSHKTKSMVDSEVLASMKSSAYLINTSRGGIVNEGDLYDALISNGIAGAAMDVFEDEPYEGPLCGLQNVILTPHLGSMTGECRARMEIEATEAVVEYLCNGVVLREVPEEEYLLQRTAGSVL